MPFHQRAAVLLAVILPSIAAQGQDPISRPGAYSGYSTAEYPGIVTHSAYVPVHDGVHLAVDYYLPTGGPVRTAFPVVLQYTPYQRAKINPETGEVRDLSTNRTVKFLLAHGYAVACADMRGTGASSGWLLDFMPAIWADGKELVDWIAAQPWCDGNVGMMGGSYLGWSQTAVASQQPKALKCIMPAVIPLEGYTGEVYPGGIYLQGFLQGWSGFMLPVQRSYYLPDQGFLPTRPAVDEDGDGALHDEIPLDQNGNGTFLDDGYPPKYADGAERKHVFYHAIKAHEKNYDYSSWAVDAHFIDSPSPLDYTMYELGPNAHLRNVLDTRIPTYHVGGWFDGFTRGTFELFRTMQATNPVKAILFPGYHGVTKGPYYEHLEADRKAAERIFDIEHLRFFDRYLKGIENGIDTEPPLYIYGMHGTGWRSEAAWPLERAELETLYFGFEKALTGRKKRNGEDRYTADFTHNSSYGENGGNRYMGIAGLAPDALPLRESKAAQCLSYTGAPLKQATEVTGHPELTFFVSSTAEDGDFFVYLEDVSPEGEAVLVTEGQLRAGFAELHDNDDIINGGCSGIDVLPNLPWHGYEKYNYNAQPFAAGRVVEMVISLQPTSWTFREGHRIRLSIACADYPTFALHPRLSPENDPAAASNVIPEITVYHGRKYPSRIELPVVKPN